MGIITALTPQRRNRERVNIYIDGQFAFGLALSTAAGLSVGQALSDEEIASLQQQDTLEQAKQRALNFLSYRPRSEAEVQRNLQQKGIDEAIIEQVINYLHANNFLDDEAFARYWIEQRETFKPRSQLALRQELAQKGVAREIIDTTVEEVEELDSARRAAEQRGHRWAHLPEDEFRKKLGSYLQRRGFHYGIVREVTTQMWRELSDQEDRSDP